MLTRTYYTTQERCQWQDTESDWRRVPQKYVRGTNLASEFTAADLPELIRLAGLYNTETELGEVRVVKITETLEVVCCPVAAPKQLTMLT